MSLGLLGIRDGRGCGIEDPLVEEYLGYPSMSLGLCGNRNERGCGIEDPLVEEYLGYPRSILGTSGPMLDNLDTCWQS